MKIEKDKKGHFIAGAIITLLSALFAWIVGLPLWLMLVPTAIAAVGKEVYDRQHPEKHTCDVWDAVATVLGAVPVIIIVVIIALVV